LEPGQKVVMFPPSVLTEGAEVVAQ
jgi:hypothetical protein